MSSYVSEAGHWYDKDGEARYTYTTADGRELKTTLRQARKYGWFPSVSGIMACAAAPALDNWKQERLADVCHANPPLPGETPEDYRKRVRAIDRDERAKAPDLGSLIHGCIEKHLRGEPYDKTYTPHVMGALDCVSDWCGLDNLLPEKSFAHALGYGGKCDLHKEVLPFASFVADFKTKDFDTEWQPKTYDNHAMQLSAYREGLGMPTARGAIIYISTQIPGLIRLVEVPQDELEKGWRMFVALLTYWQEKNDYRP